MAGTDRRDPYFAFCFAVTIKDAKLEKATGLFKSASGIAVETEVLDFKEGGTNDRTYKLVGGSKFKNIVLKRGFSGPEFTEWIKKWQDAQATGGQKPGRVSGTIQQLGTKPDQVIAEWTFTRGWPCKYELSEFDASKNEVSIETIEIAHEGISRTK